MTTIFWLHVHGLSQGHEATRGALKKFSTFLVHLRHQLERLYTDATA